MTWHRKLSQKIMVDEKLELSERDGIEDQED